MNARRSAARWLCILLCCTLAQGANAAPIDGRSGDGAPAVTAAHAILIEQETGRVLYERAADVRAPMASTTKVMTALVALESCGVDGVVTVPDDAPDTEGSKAYLSRGERLTLGDLLYALMLVSGNDAAVTIASHVAGSTEAFAELMTQRARALGCVNTNFVNPHGLPNENHYTTARELVRIAAEAMENDAFRTVVGTTYHETESGDRARTFKNKNKVLWQYEGGCGVKTGFTKAAGRCLVFAAERSGMTLIGCALNAPDMWNDAFALLDYGFARVENTRLLDAQRPLACVPVADGVKKTLAVYPNCDILYPLLTDGSDGIDWRMRVSPQLTAPVRAGETAGELTLLVNGEPVRTVPLIVCEGTARARLLDRIFGAVRRFIA